MQLLLIFLYNKVMSFDVNCNKYYCLVSKILSEKLKKLYFLKTQKTFLLDCFRLHIELRMKWTSFHCVLAFIQFQLLSSTTQQILSKIMDNFISLKLLPSLERTYASDSTIHLPDFICCHFNDVSFLQILIIVLFIFL